MNAIKKTYSIILCGSLSPIIAGLTLQQAKKTIGDFRQKHKDLSYEVYTLIHGQRVTLDI